MAHIVMSTSLCIVAVRYTNGCKHTTERHRSAAEHFLTIKGHWRTLGVGGGSEAVYQYCWAWLCGKRSCVPIELSICFPQSSKVNVICKSSKCLKTPGGTAVNEKLAAGSLNENQCTVSSKVPITRWHWEGHLHFGTLWCILCHCRNNILFIVWPAHSRLLPL